MQQLNSQQQRAAQNITQVYKELGNSNVVRALFADKTQIIEWDHYPKGDVKDFQNHTQYFYHSHPSKDNDRVAEHGHFHLFLRQPSIPQSAKYTVASKEYLESGGNKDTLTHVVAIAMNNQGLPTAFFTVNHWVVLGVWYSADVIIPLLDDFIFANDKPQFAKTNIWMTNMIRLFKPYISELLIQRDAVISEYQKKNPDKDVYYDKALEIASVMPLIQ